MQQDWRDFLQERANATGSAAPANGSYLTDLAELALIRVAGADATAFLQAQLSNDLIRVGGATSQLSSWCDAKGRVLATLRIFKREDAYLLLLPAQLSDSVCKRLKMFVLRSKVEVSDVSDALPRFALFGPDAEQLLQKTHAAPGNDEVLELEGTQCLRLPEQPQALSSWVTPTPARSSGPALTMKPSPPLSSAGSAIRFSPANRKCLAIHRANLCHKC